MRRAALLVVVLGLVTGGDAQAAGGSWATKANAVCRTYLAKAQAALGTPPKTLAQAHTFTTKAIPIEAAEIQALARIPGRTAAGSHALAVIRGDLAEARAALAAWKTSKARFSTLFVAWVQDRRPKTAFLAAGARDCG